jgi:predicted N-formylglutamate amidohydrolase
MRHAVVVSCEHAGNRLPDRFRSLFRGQRKVLSTHRAWDPGALDLARTIARTLDAPLVANTVSRLLIECNRSADHPQLFSEFSRRLPREDKEYLRNRHYLPHRGAVEAVVKSGIRTHGSVVHIGVHTFTPVLDGRRRNADVGLLFDPRRAAEAVFCELWIIALARFAPELHVRHNYPYRGTSDGLTTTLRGKFSANRYLGIELEVNQQLVRLKGWKETRADIARSLGLLLAR